jgi:hypothetical protein
VLNLAAVRLAVGVCGRGIVGCGGNGAAVLCPAATGEQRQLCLGDVDSVPTSAACLPRLQVLLRLCEPFIDPLSGKAWGKLDAR